MLLNLTKTDNVASWLHESLPTITPVFLGLEKSLHWIEKLKRHLFKFFRTLK